MGYSTVRTVKCDRQMANAYILYMMAGSLFDKASFTNSLMEGKLRNQYRELAQAKQEQQEAYTEKMLEQSVGEFLTAFQQMKSDIYVKKQDGYYFFWFRTGFEELLAAVDGNGRIYIEKAYQLTETEWRKLRMKVEFTNSRKRNQDRRRTQNSKQDSNQNHNQKDNHTNNQNNSHSSNPSNENNKNNINEKNKNHIKNHRKVIVAA